jgi:DNA polymerase-1
VLMETGRTSCSSPNMQNPPRAGGVRAAFQPRDGYVFVFCDYDTLELRALSQCCLDFLGQSEMAKALRAGHDLHLLLAAEMLKVHPDQAQARRTAGDPVIKEYRQQAKPANFGFPGGMSSDSFQEFAETQKVMLTKAQCRAIRDAWFRKWPEMRFYFNHVNSLPEQIRQLRSGRVRGGATYTAKCNGFFQGLAADGAKEALWRVACECYLPGTPLYGCKPVLFLHDEIGIEAPEGQVTQAGDRLATVMREAMQKWIPDVPITCGPVAMRRWYKGAEAVRIDGQLVPCKPEGKKWIADI